MGRQVTASEPPIRAVNPGDEYVEACEGGFKRRRVTERGFVIVSEQGDRFIPFAEVVDVVQAAVKAKQKKGDADGNGE